LAWPTRLKLKPAASRSEEDERERSFFGDAANVKQRERFDDFPRLGGREGGREGGKVNDLEGIKVGGEEKSDRMSFAKNASGHGYFKAFKKGVEVNIDKIVFFKNFTPAAKANPNGVCQHVEKDGPLSTGAGSAEDVSTPTTVVTPMDEVKCNGAPEASL